MSLFITEVEHFSIVHVLFHVGDSILHHGATSFIVSIIGGRLICTPYMVLKFPLCFGVNARYRRYTPLFRVLRYVSYLLTYYIFYCCLL